MTYLGSTLAAKDAQIASLQAQLSSSSGTASYWQSQYNAVLPPSAPVVLTADLASFPNTGGGFAALLSVTADRTGQWAVTVTGHASGAGGGTVFRIVIAGVVTATGIADATGSEDVNADIGLKWTGNVNAGQAIALQGGTAGGNANAHLEATFIPTATNPH
jgi:hypothetical protein